MARQDALGLFNERKIPLIAIRRQQHHPPAIATPAAAAANPSKGYRIVELDDAACLVARCLIRCAAYHSLHESAV
jgi:hypothetical protein